MSELAAVSAILVSAILYTFASLSFKRASDLGVGPVRTLFVMFIVFFLFTIPLPFFEPLHIKWSEVWQPIVGGVTSFLGGAFMILSIRLGDITIQTPITGIKVIFVAVLAILLIRAEASLALGLAAILATVSVFILGFSGFGDKIKALRTALLSASSAFFYALYDILIQKWAPDQGIGFFIFIAVTIQMLCGFSLIPFFKKSLGTIPAVAWPWLLLATVLLSIQGLIFYLTIAYYGHATLLNIVYTSRGLWSILLVWMVGHWFHSQERYVPSSIMRQRLIGAMGLLVAIALALSAS